MLAVCLEWEEKELCVHNLLVGGCSGETGRDL